MKKLIDAWIEHYDVESLQPRRKAALTAELIVLLLGATSTDLTLGVGDRPAWVAMWHLLAQTGMRKAEVALADGARFGKFDISWDNIKWRIGGATYPALTPPPKPLFQVGRAARPRAFESRSVPRPERLVCVVASGDRTCM